MTSVAVDRIPRTSDGTPLKVKLQRAERRRKLRAVGLVLPLFAFIVVAFVFPIGVMLFNAVHDDSLATILPRTTTTLRDWDGKDLPGEAAYAALVEDLKQGWKDRTVAEAGKRMNYELPGARSEVMASGREASKLTAGPYKQAMIAISPIWGKRDTWAILKRGASDYTAYYLMRSLDYQFNDASQIVATPPETAIFRNVFIRTLGISIGVTVATLLLGFPVAYLLASLPLRTSNLLMIMVLLPFWTSLLVRTTAWVVLPAAAWRDKRRADGPSHHFAAGGTHLQPGGHGCRHDPYTAALHPAADLQRDEDDFRRAMCARRARSEPGPSTPSGASTSPKPCLASAPAACLPSFSASATTLRPHSSAGRQIR